MSNYRGFADSVTEGFYPGDTYLVTWDGTDYECVAEPFFDTVFIGNTNLIGIEDPVHEEPFIMAYTGDSLQIETDDDSDTHTVSVRHVDVTVRPLPMQMMPRVFLDGAVSMSLVQALNQLITSVCVEWEIDPEGWEEDEDGMLYFEVPDHALGQLPEPLTDNAVCFCALGYGFSKEQAEAFFDLKTVPSAYTGRVYACGEVPEVSIPVVLYIANWAGGLFSDIQTVDPDEPGER